jgi:hypothetical protein
MAVIRWHDFGTRASSGHRLRCRASLLLGLSVLAACLLVGCQSKSNGNLLVNPSFENGSEPWYSMTTTGWGEPFEVSDAMAHSGKYSAHLTLIPPAQPAQNKVFGVVQDLSPNQFPEFVSGYYRVENWQKATHFQYLQFVVIAFVNSPAGGTTNTQIRYLLAGADAEPFEIGNAKFVFVNTAEPSTGEWVYFQRNVKEDFEQLWGSVPQGLEHVRMFFEARYDSPTATQPQIGGDVYYDDLYAGPQDGAPKQQ